jgi:hypothetical protein
VCPALLVSLSLARPRRPTMGTLRARSPRTSALPVPAIRSRRTGLSPASSIRRVRAARSSSRSTPRPTRPPFASSRKVGDRARTSAWDRAVRARGPRHDDSVATFVTGSMRAQAGRSGSNTLAGPTPADCGGCQAGDACSSTITVDRAPRRERRRVRFNGRLKAVRYPPRHKLLQLEAHYRSSWRTFAAFAASEAAGGGATIASEAHAAG